MTYNASSADQYMLSVLADELSVNEADNALTGLSVLTSISPSLFPFEDTFVRPDHQRGLQGPSGVRFVVYGSEGVVRQIHVPRAALRSLEATVDNIYSILHGLVRIAA